MQDKREFLPISKEDMKKIDSLNTGERMKPQKYENLYKVI